MSVHLGSFLLFTAAVGAALLVCAQARAASSVNAGNRIKNFGQIDKNYRGARPRHDDYAYLSSLGVKCVIDLKRRTDAPEKRRVEEAGMRFYWIPMSDTDKPTSQQIEEFLKIVNDPKNQPFHLI